jgi:hypothetical protein
LLWALSGSSSFSTDLITQLCSVMSDSTPAFAGFLFMDNRNLIALCHPLWQIKLCNKWSNKSKQRGKHVAQCTCSRHPGLHWNQKSVPHFWLTFSGCIANSWHYTLAKDLSSILSRPYLYGTVHPIHCLAPLEAIEVMGVYEATGGNMLTHQVSVILKD